MALAVLFVLSVMAPRGWQRIAHRQPLHAPAPQPAAPAERALAMHSDARTAPPAPLQTVVTPAAPSDCPGSVPVSGHVVMESHFGPRHDYERLDGPNEPAFDLPPLEVEDCEALPSVTPLVGIEQAAPIVFAVRDHAVGVLAARRDLLVERITLVARMATARLRTAWQVSLTTAPPVDASAKTPQAAATIGAPRSTPSSAAPRLRQPFALVKQLERLSAECEAGEWPMQALARIYALTARRRPDSTQVATLLQDLERLAAQDHPLLAALDGSALSTDLKRARHALHRRVEFWKAAATQPTTELLTALEAYERTGLPSDAQRLLRAGASLSSAAEPDGVPAVGKWLQENYRNANFRLAVSAELLNRLLPAVPPTTAPVREHILGVPTRGTSTATTELAVELSPRRGGIELLLHARGVIEASTRSQSGPATIFTDSESDYHISRSIELSTGGLKMAPTFVSAESRPRLRGIRTDFDAVPVVGPLVERVVKYKYDESKDRAKRESERRMGRRLEGRFSTDLDRRVNVLSDKIREGMLSAFDRLRMKPEVVEMHSDRELMVVRARLAAEDQLAANTPRPTAPEGSLASLQLHQTAANNLCQRLELEGRTFAIEELFAALSEKLGYRLEPDPEVLEEDFDFTFADKNALAVRFVEGRVELTLAFKELRNENRRWPNFTVEVAYKPEVTDTAVRFVRDGSVQPHGANLYGPQLILRGIFDKAFSPHHDLTLEQGKLAADPRFHGLHVHQWQIVDGWMSLAITATTPLVAIRPGPDPH